MATLYVRFNLIHLVNIVVNCKNWLILVSFKSSAWDKFFLHFLIIVRMLLILESWSHLGVGVYGINTHLIYLLMCMYLWLWRPLVTHTQTCNICVQMSSISFEVTFLYYCFHVACNMHMTKTSTYPFLYGFPHRL